MQLLSDLVANRVLIAALTAWGLAQVIKVPLELLVNKQLNWAILFSPGGMPSSHSALVTGATVSIGLQSGFQTPLFALAVVVSMVVLYDATGVRRQAGVHARVINQMIEDLAHGHPLREEQLKEVLGHTPLEVVGGVIFGIAVAIFVMGT